jgi:putative ABC transport system ATP-binding protein
MAIALKTEEVTKNYGRDGASVVAVDKVSIEVRQGEFVALVGPSGSGKTTMLAMLAALLSPSSGRLWIGSQDLSHMKEKDRAGSGGENQLYLQANNLVPPPDSGKR